MKRKLLLMTLMATMLASAAFVSCSKNYDTEIEQLQKDVANNQSAIKALQAAMTKGVMVSKVEAVADGYKLTMTDGSIINLNHGKNGASGTNGANGADGTNGADGENGADGKNGIQGPNGEKGDPAITPQMRVNTAKNWEMSIDGGANWVEIKDANGKAIADAKNFVKDNITVNENGNIVIGKEITGYIVDITVPSIVLVPNYRYMIVTAPEQDNDGQIIGMSTVNVPTEGYFDMWSVNSIMAAKSSAKTFTITKTTLGAAATINGVEYANGDVLYSSVGVDVILNPSKIDAENIKFKFVAALAEGELYDMPLELRATPSTKGISIITTKSAETAVWTINLAGTTSVGNLLGNASALAISAENSYGDAVRTMSAYDFDIAIASNGSVADASSIAVNDVHSGTFATIKAPENVVASAVYISADDKDKIEVYFENGAKVNTKDGEFEDYTGNYIVRQIAAPAGRSLKDAPLAPTEDIDYTLTYTCIGADGAVATNNNIAVKFVGSSSVSQAYNIPTELLPTGTADETELEFSQAELLDAIFGENSVDKADFISKGINFKTVLADATSKAGIKVQFLDGSDNVVEAPAEWTDFAKVKITVPQTAFFAQGFTAAHSAKLEFQLKQATPPTHTMAFRVNFTLNGTLEVTKVTHKAVTVPNTEEGVVINLADVKLFSGENGDTAITTLEGVYSLTGLDAGFIEDFDTDLELDITNAGGVITYKIVRTGDAPESQKENVNVQLTGVDAWGKVFTTEAFTVTIAAADAI